MFKVKNKDTGTTSMTSFWFFIDNFEMFASLRSMCSKLTKKKHNDVYICIFLCIFWISLQFFKTFSSTAFLFLTLKIYLLKPLTTNVPNYIETSQLICSANQLNGFYMTGGGCTKRTSAFRTPSNIYDKAFSRK